MQKKIEANLNCKCKTSSVRTRAAHKNEELIYILDCAQMVHEVK